MKQGATIIDVRTKDEFKFASNPKSINVPLDQIQNWEGVKRDKKIIVCCASGGRSTMARQILIKKGYNDVINAGPWRNTLY